MKRFNIFFSLVLFCASLIGQQTYNQNVSLIWEEEVFDNALDNNDPITIQTFEGAELDAQNPEIVKYIHNLSVFGHGDLDIQIIPLKTSPIAIQNVKNTDPVGSKWEVEHYISQSGSKYQANISLTPIRRTKDGFQKLEEFDISVRFIPNQTVSIRDLDMKESSVLSSGRIFKIAIPTEGVYKIDGNFLSDELGVDISNLNVNNIQLFGNVGGRLPQNTTELQPDDLLEIPLSMVGTGDGNFGANDHFLFYAEGANRWLFDNNSGEYSQETNIYDLNNYVFLKIDGSNGKRVVVQNSDPAADYISSEFDYVQKYEDDRTNLLGAFSSTEGTGKDWYGEYFGLETSQSFGSKFVVTELAEGQKGILTANFAARGETSSRVLLTVNNEEFSKTASGTNLSNIESQYAFNVRFNEEVDISNGANDIEIQYVKSSSPDEGWLDFLQLEYRRNLVGNNQHLKVSDKNSLNHESASLVVPSSVLRVWDVTDINNTSIIQPQNGVITYTGNQGLRTFYYISNTDYLTPVALGEIPNQNIHSIINSDLVIIYYSDFEEAASRLAQHRMAYDGYSVSMVDVAQIYNEFSSGRMDPTAIRDFARMLHLRDPDFKYLLLMGDGSYDYRGVTPNLLDHNFIPVYETDESLHPIEGFPSDDYFSLLSDDEGENNLRGGLDIAVGRLPVTSAEMANDVVDKIINYDINKNGFGDWRLKIAFAADDEDTNRHVDDADDLAEDVELDNPIYNQSKVYFDSYVQESTPGGDRYPSAEDAINNAVQKGVLLLNYMGHGGSKGWSQERVLKVSDIETWNNPDRLPILLTATCSFTGYDDPSIISAGEAAIQKANGGVVALFTTVRAVYASANKRLAKSVFDQVFRKVDGRAQTLGDIMRIAKNNTTSPSNVTNDRKFLLIGDPSQTIAVPGLNVVTNEINGQSISEIDTISALEKVTIKGMITDDEGALVTDFNGTIFPTVFDKESTLETLANDPGSLVKQFGVYRNILFKGSATVTNGEFEFTFVMPKDINYNFGTGRISYYAYDGNNRDAAGNFNDIIVGGTDPNATADDEGPEMELFMNDEKFVFGGTTNENPTLLALLSDDLGINVSGTSIGHDITAVLDEDSQNTFILNEFYEANVDDYTSGVVRFPLNGLEPGLHSLSVKAWDVSNNSTESRIEFTVVEQEGEELRNVFNYPNPFSTSTRFTFEHDLVGADLEVYLDIYTVSGRLVRTLEQNVFSSGHRVDELVWDARDDYGGGLAKGLYLFKVRVFAQGLNEYRESDFKKLVKI